MHPSEHKKFTHYSPLVVMSVLGLMVGLYITVLGAQFSTDNRSRAAIINGPYNGTLNSSSNIINGSVSGDVIGSSNTISGNVAGCVKGNSNIISGRVSGTVSGTGNIVALGSGGGPCLSASPTPSQAPTAVPTATKTPTPTPSKTPTPSPTLPVTPSPTKTPTPTPTKTPTPSPTGGVTPGLTLVPTATKTPTPSPTQAGPTATNAPGSVSVKVALLLHGLGNGGDSVNPNAKGNPNPKRPQRIVTVDVYNTNNQLVASKTGPVFFNSTTGDFTGTINLGNIAPGAHTVKIKTDQYLRGIVSGIQTLTAGQTKDLPKLTLIAGDVNNDNAINIVDYNITVGCYSDLLPPVSCTDVNLTRADLNDDGAVNQFDYNLFIRELTNLGGQ